MSDDFSVVCGRLVQASPPLWSDRGQLRVRKSARGLRLGDTEPVNSKVFRDSLANAMRSSMAAAAPTSELLAPGMLKRSSFRVRFEEVMEHMQQGERMFPVAALLSLPNIIDDHVPDLLSRVLLAEKTCERRGSDLRKALVLGDGEYLFFGQAA